MEQEGPFCQSCGMPLGKPTDFGTAADGLRVNDYCHFCFERGQFTDPDLTMSAMIDKGTAILVRQGATTEALARSLMSAVIPKLKRWQIATSSSSPRPAAEPGPPSRRR
jgi:hypothetical protein